MTGDVDPDGPEAFAGTLMDGLEGEPECLCRCGADAIGTDDEGRWACGLHIASR